MEQLRKEKGIKVPALENVPEIYPDLLWIWNGFQYISSSRKWAIGPTSSFPLPIEIQEIKAYVNLIQLETQDEVEEFLYFVKFLDTHWRELWFKNKPKSTSTGAPSGRNRGR